MHGDSERKKQKKHDLLPIFPILSSKWIPTACVAQSTPAHVDVKPDTPWMISLRLEQNNQMNSNDNRFKI